MLNEWILTKLLQFSGKLLKLAGAPTNQRIRYKRADPWSSLEKKNPSAALKEMHQSSSMMQPSSAKTKSRTTSEKACAERLPIWHKIKIKNPKGRSYRHATMCKHSSKAGTANWFSRGLLLDFIRQGQLHLVCLRIAKIKIIARQYYTPPSPKIWSQRGQPMQYRTLSPRKPAGMALWNNYLTIILRESKKGLSTIKLRAITQAFKPSVTLNRRRQNLMSYRMHLGLLLRHRREGIRYISIQV